MWWARLLTVQEILGDVDMEQFWGVVDRGLEVVNERSPNCTKQFVVSLSANALLMLIRARGGSAVFGGEAEGMSGEQLAELAIETFQSSSGEEYDANNSEHRREIRAIMVSILNENA